MPRTRAKAAAEINVENQPKIKSPAKKTPTKEFGRQTRQRLRNITNAKAINSITDKGKRTTGNMRSSAGLEEKLLLEPRTSPVQDKPLEQHNTAEEDVTPAKKCKQTGLENSTAEGKPQNNESARETGNEMEVDGTPTKSSLNNEKISPEGNKVDTQENAVDAAIKEETSGSETEKLADLNPGTSKTTARMSLRGQTHSSPAKLTRSTLPQQLLTVLSNLYLNASERLRLNFPPRCAEDLAYCHKHHYQSPAPELLTHTQVQSMRCALQQQRYISFLDVTIDMCYRGVFPGETIFTNLIELLLSINSTKSNNASINRSYLKSIELFSLIVNTFPPCWLEMRRCYNDFFQGSLDVEKLAKKDHHKYTKSHKIFDILLDLMENTLKCCSAADLSDTTASSPAETASAAATEHSQGDPMDMSVCSEFINQWEWEKSQNRLQSFEALKLPMRLERLFVVLRLLLQILESDLVMWLLHHHKKTKDWIFCSENRPLVVQVFEMSMYTRCTTIVRRFFTIFATAVSRELSYARLQILERYIALLMVASNTADMENTVIGVKYPYLGAETKKLISEFFKIFKAYNTSKISTYINTIEVLRIPYVRYEFIDHFLQLFYFPHVEEMSPKKIAYDIVKKRWQKYKPCAELPATADEDLSREAYLELLLQALQSYCDWHGSLPFFQFFSQNKHIGSFRTTTDSVHRWPTHGMGSGVLMLKKMAKDIEQLRGQLKMTVRMSKPKVDLPVGDICIDEEIITKYRNDLKYVMILREMLPKQAAAHAEVDFSKWQTFLQEFEPRVTAK